MVRSNIMAKKINTSMNLDEDLLKWVDSQITKKRFAHRTHAVEYALQKLKMSIHSIVTRQRQYTLKTKSLERMPSRIH